MASHAPVPVVAASTVDRSAGDETLQLVRRNVQRTLSASPAFRSLDSARQRDLANAMVRVGRYIADAGGETRDVPISARITPGGPAPRDPMLARQLEDAPSPDTAGAKFGDQGGAVAADAGVAALGAAVDNVDFPGFVSGLIDGVFNSIVKASIDQMEAYSTLLQNVAKTADQYMKDNVTEDQARDYLVDRYPDHLEADFSGDRGRVKVKSDADTSSMPDFVKDLGLPFPVEDLDDDIVEEELVPAARKRMAIDRQQLLLTLVLMGINRIVVTDGRISASVVFTLNTRDLVEQHMARDTSFQANTKYTRKSNPWFRPSTSYERTTALNVTTHRTEDSEAEVKLKVDMKGAVDLRFKSETFPLDKVADIIGVNKGDLEARQMQAASERAAQTAPAMSPPPLPAQPPLPSPAPRTGG